MDHYNRREFLPTVSFDETGYTKYPCESGKYSTVLFCKFTVLPIFTVELRFETLLLRYQTPLLRVPCS